MRSDEQAVRELHSTWIDAVNAGDLARLLTLMADDVVLINPGRAPVGRDAFRDVFSSAHQQARIHCVSDLEGVVVVGEVAYTRSLDSLSVIPTGGEEEKFAGHRMTIYRKRPDGGWVLARDVNVLLPVE